MWATDRIMDRTPDPLVTLAAVAAVTTRVRLGTSVLLGALRRPLVLAKAVASLDALAGGRVILGLGAGSRADDFAAAEVPIRERGRRTDDLVALARLAWSGQPIAYQGRSGSFSLGSMGLCPPQGSGLPIWFGGVARTRPLARAGRTANQPASEGAGPPGTGWQAGSWLAADCSLRFLACG